MIAEQLIKHTEQPETNRKIIVAQVLGFCWGVRRALELVRSAAKQSAIAALGDIIHNPVVVEDLRQRGVEPVSDVDQGLAKGYHRFAITAHGAPPDRYVELAERGAEVIDTTCPLVTKVQRMVQRLAQGGYYIVLYGDSLHPEVRGVLGWAGTSRITCAKRVSDLPWSGPRASGAASVPPRKVALIAQTTKRTDEFISFAQELALWVLPHGGELRVVNTICQPTWERQEAVARLAQHVDFILVVGGRKSSNSRRLTELAQSVGVPSQLIETPEEVASLPLGDVWRLGLTAGASTPDHLVLAVIEKLQDLGFAPPDQLWCVDPPDLEAFAD